MKRWNFSNVMLIVGLLFIYLPMLILVIYSFNASKLVTVWGGWSVKWYVGLLDNTQLVSSVGRSLEIAFYTAFSSVLLGTPWRPSSSPASRASAVVRCSAAWSPRRW